MRMAVFDIDGTLVTGTDTKKRSRPYLPRAGLWGPTQVLAWCGGD